MIRVRITLLRHLAPRTSRALHASALPQARARRSASASASEVGAIEAAEDFVKQQQRLKDDVAEDILNKFFDKAKAAKEKEPAKEPAQPLFASIAKPDFDSIPVLPVPQQPEPPSEPSPEDLARAEKLRLKKEARGRAKEMISELSEMAEYFRASEVEANESKEKSEKLATDVDLKSDSETVDSKSQSAETSTKEQQQKQDDDDWFVGTSYTVTESGSKALETPPLTELPLDQQVDTFSPTSSTTTTETASTEEFTPKWMRAAEASQLRSEGIESIEPDVSNDGLLHPSTIIKALTQERAFNITSLDISHKCEWTETIIIAEGRSKKQIFALIDGVRRLAKKYVATDPGLASNLAVEGAQTDDWMCLDLGRTVVHVMSPEARKFYDLEGLWGGSEEGSNKVLNERDEEARMVEMVERAWMDRPQVLVKTKQIEAEDLLDEEGLKERMAEERGGVFGRSKSGGSRGKKQ
ncbi:DUF143-domain-containing protein [Rhizoclosmatium globosum]|uniref:DUF143-domain-containing protein n=1 Tax=Rhizoclosmatium globosum TaxID=329046 RepID=A0A1Y2CG09_9FUNG|nr:DUF143-domain-containing protein [Rhizoclosmatium globosum]|eukprot:ORY45952.1 DUF143-domain-containing protein [Rhizoclosmatium globosum]